MSKLSKHFISLTFLIMLLCWGGCVICSLCGVYLSEVPLLYLPYLLGGFSPTIAAYIVLKKEKKVSGFRAWLKTVFDWKHSLAAYSLPAVFAAAFFLILCFVCGYDPGAPFFALLFMIPAMLLGGGLEEAGWRGVLQPELEKKLSFTASSLITAVIWWLWHLPLFHINGTSQYNADFFAFGLNVLGLSFALGTIRKLTGSTWLCVLFHCTVNSLHGIFLIRENRLGNAFAAGVLILLSYLFIWLTSRKATSALR